MLFATAAQSPAVDSASYQEDLDQPHLPLGHLHAAASVAVAAGIANWPKHQIEPAALSV